MRSRVLAVFLAVLAATPLPASEPLSSVDESLVTALAKHIVQLRMQFKHGAANPDEINSAVIARLISEGYAQEGLVAPALCPPSSRQLALRLLLPRSYRERLEVAKQLEEQASGEPAGGSSGKLAARPSTVSEATRRPSWLVVAAGANPIGVAPAPADVGEKSQLAASPVAAGAPAKLVSKYGKTIKPLPPIERDKSKLDDVAFREPPAQYAPEGGGTQGSLDPSQSINVFQRFGITGLGEVQAGSAAWPTDSTLQQGKHAVWGLGLMMMGLYEPSILDAAAQGTLKP